MDFARKQLEKYGWTDGKGLGKNENGISQALKPKLKRSVTGIGHDPASEFNEHWWKALYDKAASNVEVQEKKGITKKIKTKDDFKITNSTWEINRNPTSETKEQYSDYFVRKAVLTSDGSRMENITDSNSEEEKDIKDVFKMTDEELFVACEGRTAHKGARHGLKALGKLARIAQQEEMLLSQEKYNGYSHSKKRNGKPEQVIEEMCLDTGDIVELKKKKKKRKRCISNENQIDNNSVAKSQESMVQEKIKSDNNVTTVKEKDKGSKSKASLKHNIDEEFNKDVDESIEKPKKKRKRNVKDNEEEPVNLEIDKIDNEIQETIIVKRKKRRKNEDNLLS